MSTGIITFTDKKYFDNFRLFKKSLELLHDIPICLYYDDLELHQINWCSNNQVILKQIDPKSLLPNISTKLEKIDRPVGWRAFLKPNCFMISPFKQTFWMDSDMFVIRSLEELFLKVQNGPVFSSETCCGSRYSKEFVERLQEKVEQNLSIHVNAGLVGLNLEKDIDFTILSEWKNLIDYIDACPILMKIRNLSDQDCLLWVIEHLKVGNFIMNHIDSSKYNHSPNPRIKFKCDNLVQEIKDAYDHRLIHHGTKPHCIHWFGKNKLQDLCEKKFEDIIIRG